MLFCTQDAHFFNDLFAITSGVFDGPINLAKTQVSQLEKQFEKTVCLVAKNKMAKVPAKLSEIPMSRQRD
jgi:hypothetical protein